VVEEERDIRARAVRCKPQAQRIDTPVNSLVWGVANFTGCYSRCTQIVETYLRPY